MIHACRVPQLLRLPSRSVRRLSSLSPISSKQDPAPLAAVSEDVLALQRRISRDTTSAEDLWAIVREDLPHFDETHAVTCLSRAAKLGYRVESGDALVPEVARLLGLLTAPLEDGQLKTRSVAQLATAVASASVADGIVIQALESWTRQHGGRCDAVELANLSCALAKLRSSSTVESLTAIAAERASGLNPQVLLNMCWAAATVRARGGDAVLVIADEAVRHADRMRPQGLSNLVWSLAAVRLRNENLTQALLPYLSHRSGHFEPQGLANAVWSMAMLRPDGSPAGWMEEDALERLALQVMRQIEHFNPRELASLAQAVVSFRKADTRLHDLSPLMEALVGEALAKLDRFQPRQLTTLCWALAKVQCCDDDLLGQIADAAKIKTRNFKLQECLSMMWSMAMLRVRDNDLLRNLRQTCCEEPQRLTLSEISRLLWSHAVLRVGAAGTQVGSALVDCFADVLQEQLDASPQAKTYELANLAWAASALGHIPTAAEVSAQDGVVSLPWQSLWDTMSTALQQRKDLSAQEATNVAQAYAAAHVASPALFDSLAVAFLQRASRPVESQAGGHQWVAMADAVLAAGVNSTDAGTPCGELSAAFRDAVFQPFMRKLRKLHEACSMAGRPQADKLEAKALAGLEKLAITLNITNLGAEHTSLVLKEFGLQRAEHEQELQTCSIMPHATRGRAARQQDHHAVVDYNLLVKVGPLAEEVKSQMRVQPAEEHLWPAHLLLELKPLGTAHSPAEHAERAAMLTVLRQVRAAERKLHKRLGEVSWGHGSTWPRAQVTGKVRLVAPRTPCLSCIAVFLQQARCMPEVSLDVTFDKLGG